MIITLTPGQCSRRLYVPCQPVNPFSFKPVDPSFQANAAEDEVRALRLRDGQEDGADAPPADRAQGPQSKSHFSFFKISTPPGPDTFHIRFFFD
jgi:hypothetical protein